MQIRVYQESDEQAVIALWNLVLPDSAPHNDPAVVIRKKLAVEQDLFFVATIEERVVGTVMGGYDGHRGWIYSVAVDPAFQRQGIGAALLHRVEEALKVRGCLKANLQIRASNIEVIAFYAKLGYEVEERTSLGKRLYSSAEEVLDSTARMAASPYGEHPLLEKEFPDMVRQRPGMYVGGVDFFGFNQYVIYAISLLLTRKVSTLSLTVTGSGFELSSDAVIRLERTEKGLLPFEVLDPAGPDWQGAVVNALSRELVVSVTNAHQREEVYFTRGVQTLFRSLPVPHTSSGTSLRMVPESDVFTVTRISPTIFASAFRRLCFLYPGVRFSLSIHGATEVFQAKNGLMDLFDAVSSPYQLMHKPIRFTCEDGALTLELIMAYHTGNDDWCWSFINGARIAEGGTHEKGLKRALKRLRKQLGLSGSWLNGGVVAVMALHYPHVDWWGATKRRVNNPELKKRIARLIFERTLVWLKENPEVAKQIHTLQTDHFPDAW